MSTADPIPPSPPPVNLILQVARALQWPDTSQLPQADADFIAALEQLFLTMPGDAVLVYNATNGDAVTLIAQQADRTAFVIPPGVTQAPAIVPPQQALALDPDSVTTLATALVTGAQTLANAAVTAATANTASPAQPTG